jgi:NAD(P)-dependent dehydrogenase (short-subunit alcohol dehydrogenase family)
LLETDLQGRRAIVTGGQRGIGFAIAKAFAAEGVNIAVLDIDPDPSAEETLKGMGNTVVSVTGDVSKEGDAVGMIREATDRLGGVDIFVNNAAIADHEAVTRITREAFYRTIDTNLAACVWTSREVAKSMIGQRSGSILITGSTVRICPAYRESAYRISKMGLKMYMETLAIELAPYNVRVNMITPGHFITRLTKGLPAKHEQILKSQIPLRRFGDPAELGALAVLLSSPRLSSYITGADFVVDGGLSMRPLPTLEEDELKKLNLD